MSVGRRDPGTLEQRPGALNLSFQARLAGRWRVLAGGKPHAPQLGVAIADQNRLTVGRRLDF